MSDLAQSVYHPVQNVYRTVCLCVLYCLYVRPDVGGASDLVQGVYQTWCRVCIRPGAECVTDLVQGMYIRPGAGEVSDLVQGVFQTWCRACIRPGARCVSDLVQGVYQTWCRECIRPSGEHVSDQVQDVH